MPQTLTQEKLVATMSKAFADAILSNSDSSNQSRMINRLAADKQLLSFSGNNLEWLRFKRAFNMSTKLGAYSDYLFNCL